MPDHHEQGAGLRRVTHLGIGAHADDLEVMAIDGILRCYDRDDRWFGGVVVTDGAGAPRSGPYADHDSSQIRQIRRHEQLRAAEIGQYGAQVLLDHTSAAVKRLDCAAVTGDLLAVLDATRPQVVYTHSPADRHETHVAVMLRVIDAVRQLPPNRRPARLYGCEVWGDLDWLPAQDRVVFDLSHHQDLQRRLLAVFESQIGGGKRYDRATLGRRHAHATFSASHQPDAATGLSFAIDLTPLITGGERPVTELVQELHDRFAADVLSRLRRLHAPY